jgi:hypothetical protein
MIRLAVVKCTLEKNHENRSHALWQPWL